MKIKLAKYSFFIVAILWGSSFAFQKSLFDSIGPSILTFYNFLPAAILFCLFAIIYKKNIFYKWKEGLALGLMLSALELFQMYALDNTTAANLVFISNLGMLIIPFLGYLLFRHKIKKQDMVAIFIAIIGMYFLVGGILKFNFGDMLSVVTALAMGLYFLFSEKFESEEKSDITILCFQQFSIISIVSFVCAILFKESFYLSTNVIVELSWQVIVFTILPFVLIQWASRYADEITAAMYDGVIEPIVGAVVAWFIFKEVVYVHNIVGGLVMIFGFAVSIIWTKNIKIFN